jgi:hypothetical protein
MPVKTGLSPKNHVLLVLNLQLIVDSLILKLVISNPPEKDLENTPLHIIIFVTISCNIMAAHPIAFCPDLARVQGH